MDAVVAILVPWLLVRVFAYRVVDWDETRLSDQQADRAWPRSTKLSATVMFPEVAVPVHVYRTRRGFRGALAAFVCTIAALAVSAFVSGAAQWVVESVTGRELNFW